LEINRTIAGKGLSIGGRSYRDGIGMPRSSEVEYELNGLYDNFSAMVGMDDGNIDQASAEFLIVGDGKELWHSGVLRKSDGPRPVTVNVAGVRRLVLLVKAGPTGGGGDQADWAEAKIVKRAE
jgi:alpha-galactosidase